MLKKWASIIIAGLFITFSLIAPQKAFAETAKSIEDESIYDLLVDRFFNGSGNNDVGVNPKDSEAFNGGDFQGIISKKSFIEKMGFSIISIGAIFETETYDGFTPLSYTKIEPHFGTDEELQQLINTYSKSGMKIMIDFPLSNLSTQHEWFINGDHQQWIKSTENNKIQLNLDNKEVQEELKKALANFILHYDVSIRLTNIEDANVSLLNELIEVVKNGRKTSYVISNKASDAHFDAAYADDMISIQREIFKNVDMNSSDILKYATSEKPVQYLIDSPWSDRFILYGEQEGMYPPTRAKIGMIAQLLLPGVPVVQYGSEIAMNGEAGSEAHQLYNFKTDSELIDMISNVQQLKEKSETLRKGKFELIRNEDGYIAFTRTSVDEQWLVVINNTSRTEKITLTPSKIGENKKLIAILEPETIRANKNGEYDVILDREIIEVYHIQEDSGINKSYLITLGLVYIVFSLFVIVIVRKGKVKNKKEN